jgi:hypothetical protein
MSRRLPLNSLFTNPTLLKSLSGDAELAGTAGQAWELLLVLLPPHERVCVVGQLLHSHVGI